MDFSVSRPRIKDKEEIIDLFRITIQNNFNQEGIGGLNKDIDKEVDKQIDLLDQDFETQGKNAYYLIAKSGNKIIGTIAQSQPDSIIRNNLKIDLTNIPEIASVYVLPHFQNKGAGTFLYDNMIKHLKQNNVNEFVLGSGYQKAQQFWIKKNGEPVLLLKDYWNAGSHHMIWHVKIKNLQKI